jgi:hypothetical protein
MNNINPTKVFEERIASLEKENQLLRNVHGLSNIGSWELDAKTKKLIWSDETYKIFGYKPNEVQPTLNLILKTTHPDSKKEIRKVFDEVLNNEKISGKYSQIIIRPDGETRFLNANYVVVKDVNNKPIRVFGSVQDITQKKHAEAALSESEMKYKTLAETANDFIFIVDCDEIVQYVNPYAARRINESPEKIVGKKLKEVFQKELYERQISNIRTVIKTGKPLVIETKSFFIGREIWLSTSLSPIFDDKCKVKSVLGISRDITNRVIAEQSMRESEEKYRELIEQAADGIFVGDPEGNFIEVNSFACELSGYSKKELLKMNMSQFFAKSELNKRPLRYDLLLKGQTVVNERTLTRKDGARIIIEMNTKRMSSGNYQALMRNITERKRAENMLLQYQEELELLVKRRTHQLEKAIADLKNENSERLHMEELLKVQLKEKVILLKEIHHRVKNNMQVIISLLNLQAASIDDKKMLELYQESQNRIKSMALIHEKLYQSKDLTHIDFSEYVNSLTNYLAHSFLSEDHKIEIATKSQNIPLEYDIVIALGLIINELVSNSMKYAFKGRDKGKVEISLRKVKGNLLQLCVADNGKGISKKINFRKTKSLGLQLVCSLTEQISGSIAMTNKTGTKFCIQFPLNKK